MKIQRLSKIGTALLALAIGTSAQAVPITGTLDIAGGANLDTNSLLTATQVLNWFDVTTIAVTPGSSLDAFINVGDAVTMTGPWAFNAGQAALWTVGGFTFDLVTSGVVIQQANFLNVQGTGFISGNGFDSTPGNWFFTSQGEGPGTDNTFSFSATTVGHPPGVPDGGTTALLLGLALTVVGAVRRLSASRT